MYFYSQCVMKILQTFEKFTTIWCCLLAVVNTARILAIFPLASRSHFIYNYAIIRSLHDAGHQITFITPFADEISMTNVTTINFKHNSDVVVYVSRATVFEYHQTPVKEQSKFWIKNGIKFCRNILDIKLIQEIIHSKEKLYDVMIIQLLAMYECYLPLAEKLDIPVIGTAAARVWRIADQAMGNAFNPAALRSEFSQFYTTATFMQRLNNVWLKAGLDFFNHQLIPSNIDQIHRQYYGPELRREKDISLLFVNSHPSFFPRPLVPNAIEIGGIHLDAEPNPLPKNVQQFMDDAKDGVIVFSLGAVTRGSTMTAEMREAFNSAFAQISQRVIWKFEDEMENVPSNVLPLKWLPQRDVLAHRNVKAFMSHCGVSGTYEAIHEAVPLITIPLFSDQRSNAAILVELGVGVYLDLYTVTTEKVLNALHAVLNDTRYASNMRLLSERFKDRRMNPRESVVYWTEYVIRHKGAKHLRSADADMPLYQYFLLDVLAFISAALIVVTYIAVWILKSSYQLICKGCKKLASTKKNKNKNKNI